MAKGWDVHVYRTDGERTYVGFFEDDATANEWVKAQKEGTYEVTTQKPQKQAPKPPTDVPRSTGSEKGADD